MVATILLSLFYICFPVLVIYLGEKRLAFVDRMGPVVICYAAGLLLGNIGILPTQAAAVQDIFTTAAIPIALPLIFFSLNARQWSRTSGKAILSFLLQCVAVVVVIVAGAFLFRRAIGAETYKVAGMLVGVYTGWTINLASIGMGLQTSPALFVAANTGDMVISAIYLLFVMTIAQKVIGVFLKPWKKPADDPGEVDLSQYHSYAGFFSRKTLPPLLGAFGLALLIAGGGASFTLFLPIAWGMAVAMVTITTLGILASFIAPIRRIRMTYQLGQYFSLVFCLAVGSMADIRSLLSAVPGVLGFVTLAIFGSMILHIALCALFRVDTDTMIITSVAGICSSPFVPMAASSLKNRNMIAPGVITGVIGLVIGTYAGIGVAAALQALGL
jgi:uncharacterized membrane protein